VTIFLNPHAGSGQAGRRARDVEAAFHQRNFPVRLVETRSAEEFRREARAKIDQGSATLAAMGGDGTLQLLAREAHGANLAIGVIPVGGGNDFARALGIRSWREAVGAIAQGRTRLVDAVKVRLENGQEWRYLGGGGAGLDAEAALDANGRFRSWPGRLRYIAAAIEAFRRDPSARFEITSGARNGPEFSGQALFAAALNTPSYGGGVRLAPDAIVDDGLLDFVVLEKLTPLEVLGLLPGLVFAGKLNTKRAKRFRAASVRVETAVPVRFHGDGELMGTTPVTIEVEPKALKILVP
jgi:diacylglycerol kinase (ATP)